MANPKESDRPILGAPAPGAPGLQQAPEPAPAAAPPPASPPAPPRKSPYTGPSEMVPGGRFIDGATSRGGQLYGGRIKDAQGKTLATFGPDQVNTGVIEDGTPPPS